MPNTQLLRARIESIKHGVRRLLRDESGASAVEYGLVVAGIAGVVIVIIALAGQKLNNSLSKTANKLP